MKVYVIQQLSGSAGSWRRNIEINSQSKALILNSLETAFRLLLISLANLLIAQSCQNSLREDLL